MAGRRRPVRWSSDARADLSDIWDYHANVAGRSTADNIVRRIDTACRVLQSPPVGGRAREEIRPGLRSIAVRPHIIFYRVRGDVAEIVRILHGRRDIAEIFADAPENE